ncbi:MAG TPA: hypothetical protein PLZ21_00805 [Armatimonadota bacterium]|jgi:hypothetical protein|nr:hypothetical protein [Armatimonadota bacterium]HOP79082.1 hypothetical protein [Armatimonadota bacterium]
MAEIANLDPAHPRLDDLREAQRKAYLELAREHIYSDKEKAIRYAELAGAIRPGDDVHKILRDIPRKW